jgi:glycosyltransferase involved in cell wall biosynthesis
LYLWHYQFGHALSDFAFDLSCYHIDDEYSFSTVERPLDQEEIWLIEAVDQVFIISPGLLEKKGSINPHTTFAPEGVDYNAYATPVAEPRDLVKIPHPRIGYTGKLKSQLDWSLLHYLVQQHPEWSFLFVGPQAPHPEITNAIDELAKQRNVYFLGAKSVHDLAAYPQHFDVCIMPYRSDDYTKYIYPLKLHEYLASGRPIVGTRIRSLHEFVDAIALVTTPAEWSVAIRNALRAEVNTDEHRMKRQAIARKHDWQILVEEIARTIAQRIDQEATELLDKKTLSTGRQHRAIQ